MFFRKIICFKIVHEYFDGIIRNASKFISSSMLYQIPFKLIVYSPLLSVYAS